MASYVQIKYFEMINDSLPYILQLIKQNLIISTLVISNGKIQPDLKNFESDITGNVVQVYKMPLSLTDSFDVSFFVCKDAASQKSTDSILNVDLITKDDKYFRNSKFYFGDDEESKHSMPIPLGTQIRQIKTFGVFKIFDAPTPPAFVSIIHNPIYGYKILITFYSDYKNRIKRKEQLDRAFKEFKINKSTSEL